MQQIETAVIGGGIAGLALSLALVRKGHKVTLFEANGGAYQASVRNFGLIWPSGQKIGPMRQMALHSRELWIKAAREASFSINPNGSLYLAQTDTECDIINWYVQNNQEEDNPARILSPSEAQNLSPAVKPDHLKQALYYPSDACVQPVNACRQIEKYLSQHDMVDIQYFTKVLMVDGNRLITAREVYRADRIFVASGHFFKEWYPQLFETSKSRICKLHMMRTTEQPDGWALGPNLCGGLTLLHYPSFAEAPDIQNLHKEALDKWPDQMKHGIHVLIAQHHDGKITLGDSHHYESDVSPFDEEAVFNAIMEYTGHISQIPNLKLESRWQGVYAKSGDSLPIVERIDDYTTFVGALGGAGMTLSMGLADWVVNDSIPETLDLSGSRFSAPAESNP